MCDEEATEKNARRMKEWMEKEIRPTTYTKCIIYIYIYYIRIHLNWPQNQFGGN